METRKLIISNKATELERIQLFLEQLGTDWSLPAGLIFELNLVLEEYIVNLISYAYSDQAYHEIIIEINKEESQLSILVTDDGNPFNILDAPENDEIEKPVEERRIGGLGVHFIKKLTDHLDYQSDGGKNRMVMVKKLK